MTSLNEKWLKAVDDVGGDELSENVVAAVLKVLKGSFQGKDSCARSEVVSESGYCSRLTSQKVLDMGDLSIGTDEWGECFG